VAAVRRRGGGDEEEVVRRSANESAGGSLARVLARVRGHLRRRVGAVAVLGILALTGAILVLSWFLGGAGWRPGSPAPALLSGFLVLGSLGVLAGALVFLRAWTEESTLAREMERSRGLPAGALRVQLELDRSVPRGTSEALVRSGAGRRLEGLPASPSELAVRPAGLLTVGLKRTGGVVVGLALLLLVLFAHSPDRSRTAWAGLAHPVAIWAGTGLAPLTLDPGDALLPRGSTPRIRVGAPQRTEVMLHWQAVGEPLRERPLAVEDGWARGVLPPLGGPVRYWASAPDGARTREALIRPSDPLVLGNLVVELDFPEHTRIPPEVLRGAPEELSIPEGTRLTVGGQLHGASGTALVLRDEAGAEVLRAGVEDGRFEGSWRPNRSTRVSWEVEGAPDDAVLPSATRIEVEPDRPPEVALPVPGADGDLPASLRLPLLLEASDDHGVAWVEIEVVRVSADGSPQEPETERFDTEARREVSLRSVLELVEWGLAPGEEVLLRGRAVDVSPRRQEGVTPQYRLRVPTAAVQREAARERLESTGERVGELARRAEREAREFRELGHEARAEGGARDNAARFQDREELRQAAEAHGSLSDELEELRREMEETRRALDGLGDEDGGLRDRFRQLEALMAELADPEQRARMEELLERLSGGESPDVAAELEAMAEAREELRERLEAALERLRREALEEAFLASEEELRALAETQEGMSRRLETSEGVEAQEELAERTAAMEERMEQLRARLEEGGDGSAAERTQEAGQDVTRARESMEAAASSAQDGDLETARQEADEAAKEARQALEEMEQARMEWLEEWEEAVREALRRGAEDALALSRRQAEIRDGIPGAGARERSRLQGEETALVQGIRSLAAQLGLSTRQVPSVGREVSAALGEALREGERTVRGLDRPTGIAGGAYAAAERAIEALNRAALLALSGMEQVGEGAGSSAMDDLLSELESLAEQQEAINQQSEGLAGEQDAAGASARMEELAAAQDAVAGGVEELAQRPGGEWTPGDLDEMAREARELAAELAEGRLEPELLRRQDELLERFLGSGRMLERDGPTEEREGTTPEQVERRLVSPLPGELLDGTRIPLPTAEELEGLTPAERRLVLEYFERLNRRGTTDGGLR
jgi:hypothetical protein